MLFQEYRSAQDFREDVVPFLEQDEAVNNLPLGIVLALEDPVAEASRPLLGAVRDARGEIVLVALRTPPHNLVLAGHGQQLEAALQTAVEHLSESQVALPGVIGPRPVAKTFARLWSDATGDGIELQVELEIYRLDVVRQVGRSPGRFRRADAADSELATTWLEDFAREALLEEMPAGDARRRAERSIRQGRLFFWEDREPVSMATSARRTQRGVAISGVYTPPEFRRRGYATSCVAALSQLLLDEGLDFCCLNADLANPTSNRIYRRIGYRPVGESVVYRFRRDAG